MVLLDYRRRFCLLTRPRTEGRSVTVAVKHDTSSMKMEVETDKLFAKDEGLIVGVVASRTELVRPTRHEVCTGSKYRHVLVSAAGHI